MIMRLLQFSTLAIVALLAGCADHGGPIASQPSSSQPSRPLVQTPQPAKLAQPPASLKPPEPGSTVPEAKTLPPSEGGASEEASAPAKAEASPEGQASQGGSQQTSQPTAAPANPTVPEPAQLVGLSQADAGKIFGPPVQRNDAPPSQIWTYHSDICDLKLYFYPEVGGSAYRALTYQIDDRGANDATHHTCLTSLAKPRAS